MTKRTRVMAKWSGDLTNNYSVVWCSHQQFLKFAAGLVNSSIRTFLLSRCLRRRLIRPNFGPEY